MAEKRRLGRLTGGVILVCVLAVVLGAGLQLLPAGVLRAPRAKLRAEPMGTFEERTADGEAESDSHMDRVRTSERLDDEFVVRRLRGTVLDASTLEPVHDALVVAVSPSQALLVAPSGVPSTRTGENGFFVMPIDGKAEGILAVADGYLPTLRSLQDEPEISVRLTRGLSIVGRVVDQSGSPLAGARVWASLESNRVAWPNTPHFLRLGELAAGAEGYSDAAGYYKLRGLSPDTRYVLRCSKPQHTFAGWQDPPVVFPGSGEAPDLVLRGACRLSVRAVDMDTGEAVPNLECRFVYKLRDVMPPIDYQSGDAATPGAPEGGFLPEGWVRVTLARNNRAVPDDRFKTKVLCSAPGFGTVFKEIPLTEGAVSAEIPMQKTSQQPWGSVQFSFRFRTSRLPFSGELLMRVWAEDGRTSGNARVHVVEGRAEECVPLPLGRYRFSFAGLGSGGDLLDQRPGRVDDLEIKSALTAGAGGWTGHLTLLPCRPRVEGRLIRGYDSSSSSVTDCRVVASGGMFPPTTPCPEGPPKSKPTLWISMSLREQPRSSSACRTGLVHRGMAGCGRRSIRTSMPVLRPENLKWSASDTYLHDLYRPQPN